jgi:hypothetical protein
MTLASRPSFHLPFSEQVVECAGLTNDRHAPDAFLTLHFASALNHRASAFLNKAIVA